MDIREASATVTWPAVAGATSYHVEIGTAAGESNVAIVQTDQTSRVLTALPPGTIVVRVRARAGDRLSVPSSERSFYLQDYKYVVEALMFGTGPYGDLPTGTPTANTVRGWPRGTAIRVRLSNTITAEQRRGIETVASQFGEVGAPVFPTIEVMNSNTARCSRNEIHVVTLANACATGLGCISSCNASLSPENSTKIFGAVSIFLGTAGERGNAADVAAHEAGHAIYGLYHFRYQGVPVAPQFVSQFGSIFFPQLVMVYSVESSAFRSPDRISPLEVQAMQDVYRAGIVAGASRGELQAKGLIH